jgi:hypothetical protein
MARNKRSAEQTVATLRQIEVELVNLRASAKPAQRPGVKLAFALCSLCDRQPFA